MRKIKIDIHKAKEMYESGISLENIAKGFNTSTQTIGRRFKENGIEIRSLFDSHTVNTDVRLKDKNWVFNQYVEQDKTALQIAKEIGCSETCVHKWIKRHEIIKDERKPLDVDWLVEEYSKGKTLTELSEEAGWCITTISNRFKELGIKVRNIRNVVELPKEIYDRNYLYHHYIELKKPTSMIAREICCSPLTVTNYLQKHDIEIRENPIKDAFEMGYIQPRSGADNPNFGKDAAHGKGQWVELHGKKVFMRSTWEILVKDYLLENGYNFKYEEVRFNLGDATYSPDFFLYDDENNLIGIIEVKGWLHDRHARKALLFQTLYPDIPYYIWDKEIVKEIQKQMKEVA
jgi:predicted DNA-binding protein YlxM (UPF0122 family)